MVLPDLTPTKLRDQAALLAPEDSSAAVEVARSIEDPWFRAQALGHVARYVESTADVRKFAQEAIEAASDATDAYRQVAPCAWPIRALIERGLHDEALEAMELILLAVPRIQPNSSRAEALALLFQAGFDLGEEIRRSMAFALVDLADQDDHWRVQRAAREALQILYPVDPDFAVKLGLKPEDDGTFVAHPPRPFFW